MFKAVCAESVAYSHSSGIQVSFQIAGIEYMCKILGLQMELCYVFLKMHVTCPSLKRKLWWVDPS